MVGKHRCRKLDDRLGLVTLPTAGGEGGIAQAADPQPLPPPLSSTQGEAGRNHLNEEIIQFLPTGIG
jgi:hypothetical protein